MYHVQARCWRVLGGPLALAFHLLLSPFYQSCCSSTTRCRLSSHLRNSAVPGLRRDQDRIQTLPIVEPSPLTLLSLAPPLGMAEVYAYALLPLSNVQEAHLSVRYRDRIPCPLAPSVWPKLWALHRRTFRIMYPAYPSTRGMFVPQDRSTRVAGGIYNMGRWCPGWR